MSRELTRDEVQARFLNHVRSLIRYWSHVESGRKTIEQRLEGLAFSILTTLDGEAADLPAFKVCPILHLEDRQYYIDNDEDYYPENCDIAGNLHEQLYREQREKNDRERAALAPQLEDFKDALKRIGAKAFVDLIKDSYTSEWRISVKASETFSMLGLEYKAGEWVEIPLPKRS